MTKEDNLIFEILRFLSASIQDINITDDILRNQLYSFDDKSYNNAIAEITRLRLAGKNSINNQWKITDIGENKLNIYKSELIRDNPVAAAT